MRWEDRVEQIALAAVQVGVGTITLGVCVAGAIAVIRWAL